MAEKCLHGIATSRALAMTGKAAAFFVVRSDDVVAQLFAMKERYGDGIPLARQSLAGTIECVQNNRQRLP